MSIIEINIFNYFINNYEDMKYFFLYYFDLCIYFINCINYLLSKTKSNCKGYNKVDKIGKVVDIILLLIIL